MHSGKDKLNLKTFDQLLLVTNQLKHHTTFWLGSFDLTDDFFLLYNCQLYHLLCKLFDHSQPYVN